MDPAWVYRQYDSQLFLNTVVGPGRDAALLRLAGPGLPASSKGIALSTDSNPRWCALDPRLGTAYSVAEGVANLACVGATAKAVVNCLNFGNPEHPAVMWQLIESIEGMAQACESLGLPVIGGNVSLYNESGGRDIDPTPVIGVLGVIDHLVSPPPGWNWRDGRRCSCSSVTATRLATRLSRWGARAGRPRRGRRGGRLFDARSRCARPSVSFVAGEVARICAGEASDVSAVHDVGGGGLAVALAEMAAATRRGVNGHSSRGPRRTLL